MATSPSKPSWDRLYRIAAGQEGYFTAAQAAGVGYYPQLLAKHVRSGRARRVRRGIYRIVHFPAGERENLVVLWLWSERKGVFSHETALALHELSDALPSLVHMTVPRTWANRRLRVPGGLLLYHASVPRGDRAWHGAVPVTTPARTLRDCAEHEVPPEVVGQALEEGLARGLFARTEVREVELRLARFGGRSR